MSAVKPSDTLESLKLELAQEKAKVLALEEISTAMGSTLDLEDLLALVEDRISQVLSADRTMIFLLDETTQTLYSKDHHSKGITVQIGKGLVGWAAEHGECVRSKDAYRDPRFDASWDRQSGSRTRSVLAFPMKNKAGKIIGVIQSLNKSVGDQDGSFSFEDEQLIFAFASQTAIAVENSRLLMSVVSKNIELIETKEQLERRLSELDVLYEIAQVSSTAEDLNELLMGLLARALRAVGASYGSIVLEESDSTQLIRQSSMDRYGHPLQLPLSANSYGFMSAKYGESYLLGPEACKKESYLDGVNSLMCVPLSVKESTGCLELYNKKDGQETFGEEDLKLARLIAGHFSTAISLSLIKAEKMRNERLSSIGQLLSSVLHDLKTPMTVINGYAQLIAEEPSKSVRENYVTAISKQIEFINSLTKETLSFARGDHSVWIRKVYLRTFFEELKEQLELEMSPVRVEMDLQDKSIARFDQHKIQRAVHNLAKNAKEILDTYKPEGGGYFKITIRRNEAQDLCLDFEDNGPGIAPEIQGKILSSFATFGKTEGTGLGLAIVKKVVEDHKGQLTFESKDGRTIFHIVLPQPEHASSPDLNASIPPPPSESAAETALPLRLKSI